jgi:membrane-associated phospholipid phosphatase
LRGNKRNGQSGLPSLEKVMQHLARDIAFLWKWWGFRMRTDWRRLLPGVVIVILMLFLILPFDSELLEASRIADETKWTHRAARGISFWGDYYTGTAILAGGIWLAGAIRKSRRWRLVGLGVLASASLAGIVADIGQISFGRPRPSAEIEDKWHGFETEGKYHGFPSGHAATSMGTAAAIAFSYPPVAIPAYLAGASVCWSRIELNRHHWTDIVAGSALGVGAGFLIAYRRRHRRP